MEAQLTRQQVVDYLSGLTPVQVSNLIRELEGTWGVKAQAAVQAPPRVEAPPPAEEPQSWDVFVTACPSDKKMALIKAVRELAGLGLKEAKEFSEALPQRIKEALPRQDADTAAGRLREAGVEVDVRPS